MNIQAIIFGGAGTLVESSELHREAFNAAFAEAGIPWHWDVATYRQLLSTPGGCNRIVSYNEMAAEKVPLTPGTIAAIHTRKSEFFEAATQSARLQLRSGVRRLLNKAIHSDVRLAIASTTSISNLEALASASGLDLADFDVVLHRGSVQRPKPDPQVYERCLHALGTAVGHAVAIEDSDSGVEAAAAAGLKCIAVPGDNTAQQDYRRASFLADSLDDVDPQAAVATSAFAPRLAALDLASFRDLVADIR